MKIKHIIVDEIPKSCKNCDFSNKGTGKTKDNYCELQSKTCIDAYKCPLVTIEDLERKIQYER